MSSLAVLAARIENTAVEATHVAARWLMEAAKQAVNVNCTAYGHKPSPGAPKDFRHSLAGEPPRKESGVGQESIGIELTSNGARVGTKNIGIKNMIGGNYMAGWDTQIRGVQRPWLIPIFAQRYKPEVDRIMVSWMRQHA